MRKVGPRQGMTQHLVDTIGQWHRMATLDLQASNMLSWMLADIRGWQSIAAIRSTCNCDHQHSDTNSLQFCPHSHSCTRITELGSALSSCSNIRLVNHLPTCIA